VSSSSLSARGAAPVLADLLPGTRVRDAMLVSGYALAIAASAQLAFPLPGTPVPVTGQTFAVLLGAAALGTRRATLGGLLYAVIGLLGVPWFAGGGPHTLGYVAGFVLAGALVGWSARAGRLRSVAGAASTMVAGNAVIYAAGVTGLVLVLGLDTRAAISAGVVPFLVGDLVKIAAATALLPSVQRAVERHADR
jgi:biotin transport system substrate-specific component